MNKSLLAALGLVAVLVAPQVGAQVTFYEHDGFRGRAFTADRPIGNFADIGFNDRASSVIVQGGQWQVCEDAGFAGRCTVLRPGQYPSLAAIGLSDRISSTRRARGGQARPYVPVAPPPAASYQFYPRHGERLYNAEVVAVRAVVGPPEQRCWMQREQVGGGEAGVPGAIIGSILGGVLGHQIGSGRGNDVATAIGAVTGAAVGANVSRRGPVYTQDVQRCAAVPGSAQVAYWDVTYVFRGTYHRAQLGFAPGPTITVNGKGEPRV